MDQIIVGVDRTDTAHRAAFAASDLAACSGANLHLVTCIRDSAPYEGANRKDTRKIDSILREMQQRRRLIGDVRGVGLLIGVELVRNRDTRERAAEEAEAVMYECLDRGLSFKLTMGSILTLTPPLILTRDQMDEALAIIEASLEVVEREFK